MCRASHEKIRWYCVVFDASGINAKRSTITTDVDLTAEQCRHARLTNKLKINGKEVPIKLNMRTTYVKIPVQILEKIQMNVTILAG